MQQVTKFNILFWVGVVITIISVAFMASFGAIFTAILNSLLVIDPNGKIFDTYTAPDVPVYLDFYMFNVTNPTEVQHYGAKPKVVEIGPYRYLEKMHKFNYTFDHAKGTVEYRQNTTYFFDEMQSVGKESDRITTLNAVMVIMAAMTYENRFISEIIWPEIEAGMNLFQSFSIEEFIFGGWEQPTFNFDFSDVPILNLDQTANLTGTLYEILCAISNDLCFDFLEANKFGIYLGVNGTDDGVYKVMTGEKGMDDYLFIQEWNYEPMLHFWNDTTCNMINGTDGTQFPPGSTTRNKVIRLFTTDLCRSIYLEYESDYSLYGELGTYRFIPPKAMLQSPDNNPDNLCFCYPLPGETSCLHDSMLNMAPCAGAPVVLSTPHFYQGEEEDVSNVDGLNPQKEYHETYLDVEPTTGVVMEAAKRIQLNLPLKRYGNLPAFQNVPKLIFPVFWASENAKLSREDASKLSKTLTLPYIIVYVICSLLIVTGIAMGVIAVVKRKAIARNKKAEGLLEKK